MNLPGIVDYTNNNNNNNNNNNSASEKEQRAGNQLRDALPMSPETADEQLSVASASPLTPDSSPRDPSSSVADDSQPVDTSRQDSLLYQSMDVADRGSDRSSSTSEYSTCFPDAPAIYQQYATLKTSTFLSTSPVKGVAGLGGGVRCPPVREAVDPAKYITISGEPDGVKYACSKCGNIYKWRKSLNKHWKEKHDGEAPDPVAATSRYARLPVQAAKRPSPAPFTGASSSSATRPAGVRGSLAAILPPLSNHSSAGLRTSSSPVNGRGWSQTGSMTLQSPQLKTPTFADYTSSTVTASPFSVLAVDSMSSKERPVDLSGTAPRVPSSDDRLPSDYGSGVLDLSKKGAAANVDQSSSSVQDEPIDFSTKKSSSHSVRNPTYEPEFYYQTFAGRPLEVAHASTSSLSCAQCRQKFTAIGRLNSHFADSHSDLLQMASGTDVVNGGDATFGGSTQLYRYLTSEHATSGGATGCVVCGAQFFWRSAAAKHFDQDHAGLRPNPYQLSVAVSGSSPRQRSTNLSDHQLPATGNHLRCGRCSFTTDSFSVLARHHLRHSPRRPTDLVMPEVSRIIWGGAAGAQAGADDAKVAELQLLSGTTMSVDDVIGENTAIVIPQAPEDSAAAAAAAAPSVTKPLKHSSSGARSTGRGKRTDAGGSSTASAETLLPFKCDLCEYRARWPSEMTQHAKNHSDEKPYHCPQCTYRSKWKWDVVKHLKRCGGGGTARDVIDTTSMTPPSAVAIAAAAAASQTVRRRRTNVRSLLIDNVAPTLSTSSSSFGRVMIPAQPSGVTTTTLSSPVQTDNSVPSRQHTSNGAASVLVCSGGQDANSNRSTAQSTAQPVGDAVTTTSQSKPLSPTPAVVSLVNQGLHYCLQCSFVGHSPAELRRHLRVHSDEKPYSCRTCCYSSKWKCDLKKHLRAYNHVSAVPLAYGGHGRKPSSDWKVPRDGDHDVVADDDSSGPASQGGDPTATDVVATTLDDSVSSSLKSDLTSCGPSKTHKIPNGSNFAGITVGGRLRCRRCDFEAIDLTSFLQHKATHSAVRKDDTVDHTAFQVAATSTWRPSHHRRKSSKQVRVLQESRTDKYAKTTPVDGHGTVPDQDDRLPTDDQVNAPDAVDGSKFWTSLGLRSKLGVSCLQSADAVDVEGFSTTDVTAGGRQKEQCTSRMEAETVEPGSRSPHDAAVHELVDVAVTPSPAASSSDTDVELVDADQPVDLCRRRTSPDVTRLDAETEPLASQAAQQTSERVTTTDADDATGMSKRKRKLRTCSKCGYVTDNLTTLQRHAAKHGSTGK